MILRVLLLALLPIASASAQTTPVSSGTKAAQAPPRPFAATDTVRALHNLFGSRRSTGGWLTGGSAFFTALAGVGTLADNNGSGCSGYFCPDAAGSALVIGICMAPA